MLPKPGRHPPASKKWRGRVLLIDPTHEPQVLFVLAQWRVVETGAIHAQQITLPPDADRVVVPIHQRAQIVSRACQLFFSASPARPSAARFLRIELWFRSRRRGSSVCRPGTVPASDRAPAFAIWQFGSDAPCIASPTGSAFCPRATPQRLHAP